MSDEQIADARDWAKATDANGLPEIVLPGGGVRRICCRVGLRRIGDHEIRRRDVLQDDRPALCRQRVTHRGEHREIGQGRLGHGRCRRAVANPADDVRGGQSRGFLGRTNGSRRQGQQHGANPAGHFHSIHPLHLMENP